MHYRIRARFKALDGKVVVFKDDIPTLEEAYKFIIDNSPVGCKRVYLIDKVETELFSKVTRKVAQQRIDELRAEKEKTNAE